MDERAKEQQLLKLNNELNKTRILIEAYLETTKTDIEGYSKNPTGNFFILYDSTNFGELITNIQDYVELCQAKQKLLHGDPQASAKMAEDNNQLLSWLNKTVPLLSQSLNWLKEERLANSLQAQDNKENLQIINDIKKSLETQIKSEQLERRVTISQSTDELAKINKQLKEANEAKAKLQKNLDELETHPKTKDKAIIAQRQASKLQYESFIGQRKLEIEKLESQKIPLLIDRVSFYKNSQDENGRTIYENSSKELEQLRKIQVEKRTVLLKQMEGLTKHPDQLNAMAASLRSVQAILQKIEDVLPSTDQTRMRTLTSSKDKDIEPPSSSPKK